MEPISDYALFKNKKFWEHYTPSTKGYTESSRAVLAKSNILNLLSCLDNYDDNLEGNTPRQEIADAFATWRMMFNYSQAENNHAIFYQLNTTDTGTDIVVPEIDDAKDQNVLRHIAPPAKLYRFEVLLVQGCVYLNGDVIVEHEYKEYGESYNDSDYSWNHTYGVTVDSQTEWTVTRLNGQEVNSVNLAGLDAKIRGKSNYFPVLNYHFNIDNYDDAEPTIVDVDHQCYQDTLHLTGTKYVYFLMIAPAHCVI